jgi:predicted NUDIX family phosphoesterase
LKISTCGVKPDEKILVVPKSALFGNSLFSGFRRMLNFDIYRKLIDDNRSFLWRSKVETNSDYKQIIPYLVFNFEGKFFLMQRKSSASEQRLKNLYSLGIGGHIREADLVGCNIVDWANREFSEEINYSGNMKIHPIGLVNDESNLVGQVHTGFVFLICGDSDKISIRSELKSGQLFSLDECKKVQDSMETWSKYVFDFLLSSQDSLTQGLSVINSIS